MIVSQPTAHVESPVATGVQSANVDRYCRRATLSAVLITKNESHQLEEIIFDTYHLMLHINNQQHIMTMENNQAYVKML